MIFKELIIVVMILGCFVGLIALMVADFNKTHKIEQQLELICDYRRVITVQEIKGVRNVICAEPDGGISNHPVNQ